MAIRHMVIFELNDALTDEELEKMNATSREHLAAIPGVSGLFVGAKINPIAERRLSGVTLTVPDRATFEVYAAHENHKLAVDAIKPYELDAKVLQLTC